MDIRNEKKHNLVIFTIVFVAGIAFTVAGIWVPALLPVGGLCLSAAFAMIGIKLKSNATASAENSVSQHRPAAAQIPVPVPAPTVPEVQMNIQNNLFFMFVRKPSSPRLQAPVEAPRPTVTLV